MVPIVMVKALALHLKMSQTIPSLSKVEKLSEVRLLLQVSYTQIRAAMSMVAMLVMVQPSKTAPLSMVARLKLALMVVGLMTLTHQKTP